MEHDADTGTLRAAYRAKVREYHPDLNDGIEDPRLRDVTEAWETLKDPQGRDAYRRRLRGQAPPRRAPPRSAPTSDGPDIRASGLTEVLEITLPAAFYRRGGHFTTRIPVRHDCPSCGGVPIARASCTLCDGSGELEMRVRGSVRIPPYVATERVITLDCFLELFGTRAMRAFIRVV